MMQGAQTQQRGGMGWEVRGRFKREGTYVWLTHVDVWQKQIQYCKAIILQLKINVKKKQSVLQLRTRVPWDKQRVRRTQKFLDPIYVRKITRLLVMRNQNFKLYLFSHLKYFANAYMYCCWIYLSGKMSLLGMSFQSVDSLTRQ